MGSRRSSARKDKTPATSEGAVLQEEVPTPKGSAQISAERFEGDATKYQEWRLHIQADLHQRNWIGALDYPESRASAATREDAFWHIVGRTKGEPLRLLNALLAEKKADSAAAIAKLDQTYNPKGLFEAASILESIFTRTWTDSDTAKAFRIEMLEKKQRYSSMGFEINDFTLTVALLGIVKRVDLFKDVATRFFNDIDQIDPKSIKDGSSKFLDRLFREMENAERIHATKDGDASAGDVVLAAKPFKRKSSKPHQGRKDKAPKSEQVSEHCDFCDYDNHSTKDCRKLKRYKETAARKPSEAPKVYTVASLVKHTSPTNLQTFVIDSGASKSLVADAAHLQNVKKTQKVTLATASNTPIEAHECGTLIVKVKDTQQNTVPLEIKNVLVARDSPFNLLSSNSIAESGHTFQDGPEGAFLFLKEGEVIKLDRSTGVPSINGRCEAAEPKALAASSQGVSLLELHTRWAHLNFADTLDIAAKSGINVTHKDERHCLACEFGKSTRQHIPDQAEDRSDRMERLFHSDILPFEESSREGFKYAAIFVLDKERFVKVYGLKQKSDVTNALAQFVQDVKVAGPVPIRLDGGGGVLQCDSGTEYVKSQSFAKLCQKLQIRIQAAPPATQAKNGVVERLVYTLSNGTRTALLAANLLLSIVVLCTTLC